MNETKVKELTQVWLKEQKFKIKREVGVSGSNREVILDFYGYREQSKPEILWIECKGDQNLSELLEGFIRTEFAIYYGGGKGILAAPSKAIKKLINYSPFLNQAANIIKLLDVENKQLYQIKSN